METSLPPNEGIKRPQIRNQGEEAGNLANPKGSFFFLSSKSVISPMARPMKYSITAARLLPAQETRTPTRGPKMAPLRMTIGSVGMGVAESSPMRRIEKSGPAIPVVGITRSMFFMSLAKTTITRTGSRKVAQTRRIFFNFLKDMD